MPIARLELLPTPGSWLPNLACVYVEFIDLELLETSTGNARRFSRMRSYNLAAQSFVGTSFELPLYTSDVDALGVLRPPRPCARRVQACGVIVRKFGKADRVPGEPLLHP